MNAPAIGSEFTSLSSKITGTVMEIVEKPFGYVIRLDINGTEKWTTLKTI